MVRAETGVDLSSSRVRVGVSRGHLLETVILVPLDESSDETSLERAADRFLERTTDTALLDTWVGSVDVDRIARAKGLLVMSDVRVPSESYPLSDAPLLISRGIEGICSQLPESLLTQVPDEGWAALEIPTVEEGLQGDRTFASTRVPEALKSVLEGLPFSSCRFTRGSEIFVWLAWDGASAQRDPPRSASRADRLALRFEVEEALSNTLPPEDLAIVGSGFGPERDFLDLCIAPRESTLDEVLAVAERHLRQSEFGFYDDALCDLSLTVP